MTKGELEKKQKACQIRAVMEEILRKFDHAAPGVILYDYGIDSRKTQVPFLPHFLQCAAPRPLYKIFYTLVLSNFDIKWYDFKDIEKNLEFSGSASIHGDANKNICGSNTGKINIIKERNYEDKIFFDSYYVYWFICLRSKSC